MQKFWKWIIREMFFSFIFVEISEDRDHVRIPKYILIFQQFIEGTLFFIIVTKTEEEMF